MNDFYFEKEVKVNFDIYIPLKHCISQTCLKISVHSKAIYKYLQGWCLYLGCKCTRVPWINEAYSGCNVTRELCMFTVMKCWKTLNHQNGYTNSSRNLWNFSPLCHGLNNRLQLLFSVYCFNYLMVDIKYTNISN